MGSALGGSRSIAIDARIINTSTGTYVQRLLEHLQDVDHVNTYTVFVPSKDLRFWKPRAANFRVQSADFANYSFGEQIGFNTLLRRGDFDLVHFCMPQQPMLYNRPSVTTFHDLTLLKTVNSDKNPLVFRFKQVVGRLAFRVAARRARAIVAPTQFTKTELVDRYPFAENKIVVTYEAAEKESADLEPIALPSEQYLLYVGSQSDYKNIPRLIRAHQRLLDDHPDLWLVLAGREDSAVERTKEFVRRTGARQVHFTGFVTNSQRNQLFSDAAAYVFPSLMEGFGLPGLEAMLWGAPVVSSNATCLPEVYGDAAEYFDPTNVDEIANAVQRVIESPYRRQELAAAGRARVGEFSWRRMAEQTHAVYAGAMK